MVVVPDAAPVFPEDAPVAVGPPFPVFVLDAPPVAFEEGPPVTVGPPEPVAVGPPEPVSVGPPTPVLLTEVSPVAFVEGPSVAAPLPAKVLVNLFTTASPLVVAGAEPVENLQIFASAGAAAKPTALI